MNRLSVEHIEYHLPETIVTNEALAMRNPDWQMDKVAAHTGVKQRHIAEANETALDLAFEACKKLGPEIRGVDAIVFCTQSGDYIMPSNACVLHKLLELPENVLAFDFNLACSGYIYGLAIVRGLLLTGAAKKALLVTGDTYSKYINKKDRSSRVLFGDGASASILSLSASKNSVIDIECATAGKGYEKFIIMAGGCRTPRTEKTREAIKDNSGNMKTSEDIQMDGMGILTFVNSRVPEQIRLVLSRNSLKVEDIELFIFHQASSMALDSLTRLLSIKPEKVFRNMENVGNTVSTSIPMALKDALTACRIKKGGKVILCGFGAGLSWATALLEA